MDPRQRRLGRLLLAALACTALVAAPAAAALPVPPAAPAAATSWALTPDPAGYRITLRTDPLPMRAAAPALEVDGVLHAPALVAPDRRSASVVVADPRVHDVRLVWWGEDAAPPAAPERTDAATAPALPQAPVLASDPGRRGPFRVRETRYDEGDQALALPALGGRRVEVRALVTAPVGAPGRRPLVLLLHGQHETCWAPGRTGPEQGAWPCPPGWAPVPSADGYQRTARLLASHGVVVVSASANGVNAAVDSTQDGGAQARAELLLAHLDRWRDRGHAGLRVDLRRVGLLGHSRGGEGVVRALALDATRERPYGIRAVLPLAPTDVARTTTPGAATAVLTGYCDGDVVALEGVRYLDDTRYAAADDVPRSTTVLMGATHNAFNAEWTPGDSTAPSRDDWTGPAEEAACGADGPGRLAPAEQRAAAATHAAAFFGVHLLGRADWAPLLDGSGARAPSLGRAVLRTSAQAPSSARTDVARLAEDLDGVRVTGAATAVLCRGAEPDEDGLPPVDDPPCATETTGPRHPHHAQALLARQAPGAGFALVRWTGRGAVRVALRGDAADASRARALTFRAAPAAGSTDLSVRVTDRAGRRATVPVSAVSDALRVLPGTGELLPRQLLQQVRVPVRRLRGLDLRHLARVELVTDRTPRGAVLVTDLAWVREGAGRPDRRPRPAVTVADVGEVAEGAGSAHPRAAVRVRLQLSRPAGPGTTVHLETDQHPLDPAPVVTALRERVAVPVGAREVVVDLPHQADDRDDEDVRPFRVVASTPTEALVLDPVGTGALLDDDPSPVLEVGDGAAVESAPFLELPLRLDRPSDRVVFVGGLATGVTATHREDFGSPADPDEGAPVAGEVQPGSRAGALLVPLLDDDRVEGAEALRVELGPVVGAALPLPASRTGTIHDDDDADDAAAGG